jgi:hypothetical protein
MTAGRSTARMSETDSVFPEELSSIRLRLHDPELERGSG